MSTCSLPRMWDEWNEAIQYNWAYSTLLTANRRFVWIRQRSPSASTLKRDTTQAIIKPFYRADRLKSSVVILAPQINSRAIVSPKAIKISEHCAVSVAHWATFSGRMLDLCPRQDHGYTSRSTCGTIPAYNNNDKCALYCRTNYRWPTGKSIATTRRRLSTYALCLYRNKTYMLNNDLELPQSTNFQRLLQFHWSIIYTLIHIDTLRLKIRGRHSRTWCLVK